MAGKPAARVGDPTACPLPGHGTNPIAAGSADVLFDGMPAARQGDPAACDSALVGNVIPTVLINSKPATTLGTLGSHGNVVIGGSGTVIIGSGHSPAAFTAPAPLTFGITSLSPAAAPPPSARQPSHDSPAQPWQEQPDDPAPLGLEEEEEEEERLLRQRYIHLSANWNASAGHGDSVLDVVFTNAPAESERARYAYTPKVKTDENTIAWPDSVAAWWLQRWLRKAPAACRINTGGLAFWLNSFIGWRSPSAPWLLFVICAIALPQTSVCRKFPHQSFC